MFKQILKMMILSLQYIKKNSRKNSCVLNYNKIIRYKIGVIKNKFKLIIPTFYTGHSRKKDFKF